MPVSGLFRCFKCFDVSFVPDLAVGAWRLAVGGCRCEMGRDKVRRGTHLAARLVGGFTCAKAAIDATLSQFRAAQLRLSVTSKYRHRHIVQGNRCPSHATVPMLSKVEIASYFLVDLVGWLVMRLGGPKKQILSSCGHRVSLRPPSMGPGLRPADRQERAIIRCHQPSR